MEIFWLFQLEVDKFIKDFFKKRYNNCVFQLQSQKMQQ